MLRLPCDNLREFIEGMKIFYTVYDDQIYQINDLVSLYNDNEEHVFVINYIHYMSGRVLALEAMK